MKTKKLTIKALRELSPWVIAKELSICYSGDMNTIPHGGYFYSTENWKKYGYADAVEFCDYEGRTLVTVGTIHKNDLVDALRCCGFETDGANVWQSGDEPMPITPEIEIECCQAYAGIETDHWSAEFLYDSDNEQQEFQAFKWALPHIMVLVATRSFEIREGDGNQGEYRRGTIEADDAFEALRLASRRGLICKPKVVMYADFDGDDQSCYAASYVSPIWGDACRWTASARLID